MMAEYYYNTNNDEKAIEFIEKYESQDPNSPLAYQMKALVYENKNDDYGSHFNWGKYNIKKGNTDVALNEYLNAYAADKSQVEVIKEIINVYTALEDNIAAIEFCEKLVEIEKDDIATLKKLVAFYDDQGYKERVIYYLEMLDELNPRDYDTLLRLAKYYESSRQMGEALEYYERYLKNAPSSEEREKIEKKVNQMQTGEGAEEEGFLDKLMGLFSKK